MAQEIFFPDAFGAQGSDEGAEPEGTGDPSAVGESAQGRLAPFQVPRLGGCSCPTGSGSPVPARSGSICPTDLWRLPTFTERSRPSFPECKSVRWPRGHVPRVFSQAEPHDLSGSQGRTEPRCAHRHQGAPEGPTACWGGRTLLARGQLPSAVSPSPPSQPPPPFRDGSPV